MDIWTFVIVCPLVGLAGFIDAIAGGGGLISLPAYLIAGLPPHAAIGTNKFGSCCGTCVATDTFKVIMLIILPLTGVYVLNKKALKADHSPYSDRLTILIVAALSFVIGIYDGFYGPGTGTFLMLLLTAVAHVSLNEAAGITKVINLSTNVAALAVFLTHGVVWMPLAIAAAAFSIVGNYLGARYFVSKGTGFVKPVIIVVLTLFFIKLCYELFLA